MKVLVDTSVWSQVLRRGEPENEPRERELRELLREGRAVLMGPIRQELLSGIRVFGPGYRVYFGREGEVAGVAALRG